MPLQLQFNFQMILMPTSYKYLLFMIKIFFCLLKFECEVYDNKSLYCSEIFLCQIQNISNRVNSMLYIFVIDYIQKIRVRFKPAVICSNI